MNIIEIFSKVFEQKITKNRLDFIQNSSGKANRKANDNWKIKLPSDTEQRQVMLTFEQVLDCFYFLDNVHQCG